MTAVVANDPAANIIYSQVMRNIPSDSLFSVTEEGVVNVIGLIDRETDNTYDVQIQVWSLFFIIGLQLYFLIIQAYVAASGLPNSTTDTTLLTITVLDVNDNSPIFENPHPDAIILMEVS